MKMKHEEVAGQITYIDYTDHNGWQAHQWRVELAFEDRQFETDYYTGAAITAEPTVKDVLEALFADAATVELEDGFEGWCAQLGYDADSIRDKTTFDNCVKNSDGLRHLLGGSYGKIRNEIEQEWN